MGKTWKRESRQSSSPARWLVRALCLGLMPLVIMASAQLSPAAAEPALFSDPAEGDFSTGASFYKNDCHVSGYYKVIGDGPEDVTVEVNGRCKTGAGTEDQQITLQVSSPGCTFTGGPVEVVDRFATVNWSMTMTASLLSGYDQTTCNVTQGEVHFCYSEQVFPWEDPNYGDNCEEMMFDWPLGQPPAWDTGDEDCAGIATVRAPVLGTTQELSGSGRVQWVQNIEFPVTTSTAPSPNTQYLMYAIVEGPATGWTFWENLQTGNGYPNQVAKWSAGGSRILTSPTVWFTPWRQQAPTVGAQQMIPFAAAISQRGNVGSSDDLAAPQRQVVGVGIIIKHTQNFTQATTFPPSTGGLYGLTTTTETACAFYWGQKAVNITDSTEDEPVGPIGGPPPPDNEPPDNEPTDPEDPEDNGCDFSFGDPSSWLEGGICMLVGLIGEVINLLGNILGAIAGLVGELLEMLLSLFIPSEGFLEGKLEDVRDAWADTAPFAFLDGIGGIVDALSIPAPGSSCEGPALTFTDPVSDSSNTLRPLSSCDGAMSTVAGLVKAALTVAVYVGGFLVAARVVAAAFGMTVPGVGRDEATA